MDPNEKNLDYFAEKFTELANDARQHGLHIVVLIENQDPIRLESSVWKLYRGSVTTSIGLLQGALFDFQPSR